MGRKSKYKRLRSYEPDGKMCQTSQKFKLSASELVEFKRRRYSRLLCRRAIDSGTLTPSDVCEVCKSSAKTQAHHVDYGKPLEVIWMCSICHGIAHREDHPLNPNNNKQTRIPDGGKFDAVTVSLNIPVRFYLALRAHAENTGKSISKILRDDIIAKYDVESNQLQFNFEGLDEAIHNSQQDEDADIQQLVEDEGELLQSQTSDLQQLWEKGGYSLPGMEGRFSEVLRGHGGMPGGLQRARVN